MLWFFLRDVVQSPCGVEDGANQARRLGHTRASAEGRSTRGTQFSRRQYRFV